MTPTNFVSTLPWNAVHFFSQGYCTNRCAVQREDAVPLDAVVGANLHVGVHHLAAGTFQKDLSFHRNACRGTNAFTQKTQRFYINN